MSEAELNSIQKRHPVTITFAEIHNLVDRLRARAQSFLLRHEPEQAADVATAAAVITAMARSFNHGDLLTIENGV